MQMSGEVIAIEKDDGGRHERRIIRIDCWPGRIELNVRVHEARAYQIGRRVTVSIEPVKKR